MNKDLQSQIEKKSVDTGQGEIFYFLNAPYAGKPTVVFLHGLSSNHTTWIYPMKALQKNGYNSLAVELRGHGLSDKTKKRDLYKLPVFANDLKLILEKENVKNPALVGYSFGGAIVIYYAARYQKEGSLVLVSASHVSPLIYKKLGFLAPAAYWFLQILAFLLLWQGQKKYRYYRHGESRGYWQSVWTGLNTMPLSVNFWMLSEVVRLNLKSILPRVKVPTLIIRAKNDPFVSPAEARDMAASLPKSEIAVPKSPSHFIASRSQKELIEIILGFLKKNSPR